MLQICSQEAAADQVSEIQKNNREVLNECCIYKKNIKNISLQRKILHFQLLRFMNGRFSIFMDMHRKRVFQKKTFSLRDIENFLSLRKKTLNNIDGSLNGSTINKAKSAIRSFCIYLQKENVRSDNPSELVQAGGRGHRLPEVFDVDQIETVLEAIDTDKEKRNQGQSAV